MTEKLKQYALLMRLDKPVGIYLLLWPMLWGLWVAAEGSPDLLVLLVFIAGVVLMRSAGCVINDFADRKIDGQVARTRERPLATGKVSSTEAIVLFCVLSMIAFALVLLMNKLTVYLSFVAVILAASYPFMKRYTHLPQFYLGLSFGWAIPMAFAAQTGQVPMVAWLLLLVTLLWAVIYDTMYAMVDREDDLKIGVKSTAILFGKKDRLVIGVLQLLMLAVLFFVGRIQQLQFPYYASLGIVLVMMIYHQVLIENREPQRCFAAFKNNHWIGLVILLGFVSNYQL